MMARKRKKTPEDKRKAVVAVRELLDADGNEMDDPRFVHRSFDEKRDSMRRVKGKESTDRRRKRRNRERAGLL